MSAAEQQRIWCAVCRELTIHAAVARFLDCQVCTVCRVLKRVLKVDAVRVRKP